MSVLPSRWALWRAWRVPMSDLSGVPGVPGACLAEPRIVESLPPPMACPLHQNTADPAARWLVQKFGGTSIGKFPVQIARDIVA